MLIGDFNETVVLSNKIEDTFNLTRATIFANFFDNYNLLDLSTMGATLCNITIILETKSSIKS